MFTEEEIEYLTEQRLGPGFDAMLIRIRPTRITSWGIATTAFGRPNSRTVGASR